jgi:hypothetical protein
MGGRSCSCRTEGLLRRDQSTQSHYDFHEHGCLRARHLHTAEKLKDCLYLSGGKGIHMHIYPADTVTTPLFDHS